MSDNINVIVVDSSSSDEDYVVPAKRTKKISPIPTPVIVKAPSARDTKKVIKIEEPELKNAIPIVIDEQEDPICVVQLVDDKVEETVGNPGNMVDIVELVDEGLLCYEKDPIHISNLMEVEIIEPTVTEKNRVKNVGPADVIEIKDEDESDDSSNEEGLVIEENSDSQKDDDPVDEEEGSRDKKEKNNKGDQGNNEENRKPDEENEEPKEKKDHPSNDKNEATDQNDASINENKEESTDENKEKPMENLKPIVELIDSESSDDDEELADDDQSLDGNMPLEARAINREIRKLKRSMNHCKSKMIKIGKKLSDKSSSS